MNDVGTCLNCGNETKWDRRIKSIRKFCCLECSHDYRRRNNTYRNDVLKREQTCLKKYGTKTAAESDVVKQKIFRTNLKKYGSKSALWGTTVEAQKNIEKRLEDNFKKYGTRYPSQNIDIKEKGKKTCVEKYGSTTYLNSKFGKDKARENMHKTVLLKYGVNNVMQVKEIFEKQQNSLRNSIKKYVLPSGKEIIKQGYEPQFLDYIFQNQLLKEDEINYYPEPIDYDIDGKVHRYFPDFLIPKYNLIVETKSSYTNILDKNVKLKEQASIDNGYKYLKIINNDFTQLKEFINAA